MSLRAVRELTSELLGDEEASDALRDEYLLLTRPTEEIQAELETAIRRGPTDSPRVGRLQGTLQVALERDRRVATRRGRGGEYADCWCLGVGGRDTYMLSVQTPTGPTAQVRDGDGLVGPFEAFRQICSCPAGQQRAADLTLAQEELDRAYDRYVAAQRREVARLPKRAEGLDLASWRDAVQERTDEHDAKINDVLEPVSYWTEGHLNSPPFQGLTPVLLLAGGFGNGKTTLAAWTGYRFLGAGYDVVMRKVAELLAELRAAPWRASQAGEQAPPPTELGILRQCAGARLLILDDLGAEDLAGPTADRDIAALLLMIDQRIDAGLPTAITTNLSAKELRERVGGRLFDRLVGDETSTVVKFKVPSLRRAEW